MLTANWLEFSRVSHGDAAGAEVIDRLCPILDNKALP
jgi:hypothetical protein